jgi:outer membrane protein TolC
VVLTAFQEVEDDLAALRILEQEKAVTAAAVQSADLATKLTLNEFEAGTVIYTAVITQQEIQLSDEVTDLTVQQSRLVSSVGLIQALGGGWSTAELPSKNDLQKGLGYIPFANPL